MTEPPNRSAAPRGGGEAARLAVLSAFGGGAVDLGSIVGIEETGLELRVTDGAGQSAALALDSPAARADLLYRLAEWCAPALEPKIGKLVSGGARLAGAPGEAARESWALALECGVAGALAWLSGQWFLWLAAGIYALIRAFTRIRRIAAARTPIVFLPAGKRRSAASARATPQFPRSRDIRRRRVVRGARGAERRHPRDRDPHRRAARRLLPLRGADRALWNARRSAGRLVTC